MHNLFISFRSIYVVWICVHISLFWVRGINFGFGNVHELRRSCILYFILYLLIIDLPFFFPWFSGMLVAHILTIFYSKNLMDRETILPSVSFGVQKVGVCWLWNFPCLLIICLVKEDERDVKTFSCFFFSLQASFIFFNHKWTLKNM